MTTLPSDHDPEQLELAAKPEIPPPARSRWSRVLRILHPSHTHSVFSASVLLAGSSVVSGLVGLVRGKYIAWVFGAGPQTDAYMAAFRLPDLMNNFLVGGAVSITFVTILNRYRERGEEEEGERLLFTVLNLMVLALTAASIVLMFLAAPFVRWTNPGFPAEQVALCAHMTRILLPAQIFLFAGSVLGATLLVRKQFLYQAATPILYNVFIIACGVLLHRKLGVSSLAIGATAGFLFGSLGMNAWGAARERIRFRWQIDLHHPGLRMWLFMTLPLMFGFTLPFLDQYFAGFYASHGAGDITRLANAKQLFSAPMAILAQAAGVASMPFFAQLWAKDERFAFASGVADSVSRVMALSILAASVMIALSQSIVELVFGGGRFTAGDVNLTAWFLAFYTVSLFAWSAQAIYARAFYAAGITWLPMLASTIILFLAFPLYGFGYRTWGAGGLAIASDAGIILQAATLAVLLHRRRMVSLASLDYVEMGRCLMGGIAGGTAGWLVTWTLARFFHHLPRLAALHHARSIADAAILLGGTAVWAAVTMWVLDKAGSALPRVTMRRLRLG
ncbi:MAG TPA: murein biosynthesis integral membrane protein MurJ [Terracidiphilus sp.]